jgi:hypothetical protein
MFMEGLEVTERERALFSTIDSSSETDRLKHKLAPLASGDCAPLPEREQYPCQGLSHNSFHRFWHGFIGCPGRMSSKGKHILAELDGSWFCSFLTSLTA